MRGVKITACLTCLITSICVSAFTQSPSDETCPAPVYQNSKELSRKATIKSKPSPGYTEEARHHHLKGRVVLKVVLCQTGNVTDIKAIEGLPFGMTERVIAAARKIDFTPAEKDGHSVSQRLLVKYYFNLR